MPIFLVQDNNDSYWLIASNKLWHFDKNKNLIKELTQDLLDLSVDTWNANDVFVDDHNRLWIATGLGLYLVEVKANPFKHYLQEKSNTSTRGIIATSADELFIASYHGSKKLNTKNRRSSAGLWGIRSGDLSGQR